MKNEYNYTVLGVSSGIGVSLYPFRKKLIGNCEARSIFHSIGDKQWNLNFKGIPLFRKGDELLEAIENRPGIVDIMISSPDCGSGSVLRFSRSKKLGNHVNNDSLWLFFSMVEIYKPKIFYFENLEGLYKSFTRVKFNKLLRDYRLVEHVASVSHWGNSQINRKRLVVIGIRKDLPKKLKRYFKLPPLNKEKLQCCELLMANLGIEEIPGLCHVREDLDTPISIHAGRKLTPREIVHQWTNDGWGEKRFGKKRWETPGYKFSTAPGVYRNLFYDLPATARKANRQFDHDGYMLTPRQLARIQGVPDEFGIYFDPNKPLYWINKGRAAVTKSPPMEISTWFKKQLQKSYKLWK